MQEAADSESGEQLPADAALSFRGAHWVDAAGAERKPPGVSPRGAGRVSAPEEKQPGGGGGPV